MFRPGRQLISFQELTVDSQRLREDIQGHEIALSPDMQVLVSKILLRVTHDAGYVCT